MNIKMRKGMKMNIKQAKHLVQGSKGLPDTKRRAARKIRDDREIGRFERFSRETKEGVIISTVKARRHGEANRSGRITGNGTQTFVCQ